MTILSVEDAHQLYLGTIVEFNGELYYVMEVENRRGGAPSLQCRNLQTSLVTNIPAEPDLVCCPTGEYRLGYVQYNAVEAGFLQRGPRRQFRVGWSEHNVAGLRITQAVRLGEKFVNNMKGIYPNFESALKQSIGASGIAAFDRQFAIYRGREIFYMGSPIGYYDTEKETFTLNTESKGISTLLKKAME